MKLRTPVGTLRSKSWRTGKCALLLLVVSLVAGLSACAPKRLKVDFTGFERAYAETSNQELLLNLARLENRDPTGELDEQAHPIVQLGYRGKVYRIADEKSLFGSENQYWNRDVFRLVNQLSSQVTVDISKFPLTEILQ